MNRPPRIQSVADYFIMTDCYGALWRLTPSMDPDMPLFITVAAKAPSECRCNYDPCKCPINR